LILFEAGELIPIELSDGKEAWKRRSHRVDREASKSSPAVSPDVRERVGRNLRWAFPLPDTGSFVGLLDALDNE
jgi:hypothetical protein